MDYFRVVYTLENRVHSVLVPLIRIPEPGETITVDHGRKAVVRTVETDADRPEGVTLHVDLTGA
jgi:hypothetical protein